MKTYRDGIKSKISTYILQVLRMREYRRNWYKGDCVLCGKKDKLGINLADNRANCFYCGNHKNPITYIMKAEGLETYSQAYKFLGVFKDTPYLEAEIITHKDFYQAPQLPEGFKVLSLGDSQVAKLARAYVKKRGLDPDLLALKGVGYCDKGDYAGCIVFPYHQQGQLVYYQARKYIHTGGPKFKFPRQEEFGIGKTSVIYNIDALHLFDDIDIVESMFNAETLGDNAIAIGGKAISHSQFTAILKSPCKTISILLDPDAYYLALKLGMNLAEYKKVKVVKLPEGTDVNELGRKETLSIKKATPWKTYSELYQEFISLP